MLLTQEQYTFLFENVGMKRNELAKALNITRQQASNLKSYARKKIWRMKRENSKKYEINPKQEKLYPKKLIPNPNPPTMDTEVSICQYYFRGISINRISCEFGRTEEFVQETLNRCMENGNYRIYNSYGR